MLAPLERKLPAHLCFRHMMRSRGREFEIETGGFLCLIPECSQVGDSELEVGFARTLSSKVNSAASSCKQQQPGTSLPYVSTERRIVNV
eukprot:251063-Rhodomonas_salina.5